MSIARLTWQPVTTSQPETLIVDMPATHIAELQKLLAEGVDFGDAAIWISVRDEAGTYTPRLFRLARINGVVAEEPTR